MGEAPDRIRATIEQTRAEMSETVDALGYKADVKTRAKENLHDKRDSAKESIVRMKSKAHRGVGVAQENPLGLAIGAVAVGFVAGMLLPSTRVEDDKLGDASDSVIAKAKETGQEALEHGKQVAQDTVQSAQETMKESGQEHAQQVKDSAQETASSGRPSEPTVTTP